MNKMENFGKLCFIALSLAVAYLLGGYVFMKLWQWFVVSAFAVQPITLIQSIGLTFVLVFLRYKYEKKEKETTWDSIIERFKGTITFYIMALILGYLITLFQ